MRSGGAGIQSLAVCFPKHVRTNAYWTEGYPDVVATARERTLGKLWNESHASSRLAGTFERAMAPYLADPFRGTIERRVLDAGCRVVDLEKRAAEMALGAAGMSIGDIDLLMVSSFLSDTVGVGNAASLADALGLRGMAFNLESACSSSLVALQNACALVRSGEYRHVLVVVSCTYSRTADPTDTLSWTVGDGAAAFIVGPLAEGEGWLGASMGHTGQTCGALYYEPAGGEGPDARFRMRATSKAARSLREISEAALLPSCHGAAKAAGIRLENVDFFIFNTPVAWYAQFCADALGVSIERTVNTYPMFANTGPVLMPTNLHHAAVSGKVKPGNVVMLYTIGSVSSVGAAVIRWSERCKLGPAPA